MKITELLTKYRKELELKNYSDNSIKLYINTVYSFLFEFQDYSSPDRINVEVIKDWLRHSSSISVLKIRIGALKNFYSRVIHQPLKFKYIEYPRSEKKLPRIINQEELKSKILSIPNKKHKAILALAYCCSLRVSEVVNLKISDIDGKQKIILIRQAKGNKDRYTGISESTLEILRDYFRQYRPKEFLFEGQLNKQYSVRSCEEIYHKYIDIQTSFHSLRHSGITSMIESGTNILAVQVAVGHNRPSTTQQYFHVSPKFLSQISTPI